MVPSQHHLKGQANLCAKPCSDLKGSMETMLLGWDLGEKAAENRLV